VALHRLDPAHPARRPLAARPPLLFALRHRRTRPLSGTGSTRAVRRRAPRCRRC
jgi:hypothetical protein